MIDYTSLSESLNEVKTNPATNGLASADQDTYLSGQLSISAGISPTGQTIYRPYYVAARFLEQLRSQQTISEADGAKFTNLALPIHSLFAQQAAIDKALALTIPPGMGTPTPNVRRFNSASYVSQARP